MASQQAWKREQGIGRLSAALDNSTWFILQGSDSWCFHRHRNIWPFEHARARLQKQKLKQHPSGKLHTPPLISIPGALHPQPTNFLPPATKSLSTAPSIQLPARYPAGGVFRRQLRQMRFSFNPLAPGNGRSQGRLGDPWQIFQQAQRRSVKSVEVGHSLIR